MSANPLSAAGLSKRVDLHCHSNASNEADEAVLNALKCPESYSLPEQIYKQAIRRGMDFVTITDHDSIEGVAELEHHSDVFVGEEVTCYFPEDRCKIHLLVWGINDSDHDVIQSLAGDIYRLADYIRDRQIAHAVAHPLYRQNDLIQKWHLERLILMYKGFECLNGAHSPQHQDAFEAMIDDLNPQIIQSLADVHGIAPRWPEPWKKSRTGGSDDHGLLNIGRTWTEFPATVKTPADVLHCIREGICRPGGEAGSGIKLAHNFYGVAVRYFGRQMIPQDQTPSLPALLMQAFVGERPVPKKRQMVKLVLKHKLKGIGKELLKPWKKRRGGGADKLIGKTFLKSAKTRMSQYPGLLDALKQGEAPLGQHRDMFSFASDIDRDLFDHIVTEITESAVTGQLHGIFDGISALMAQQFMLLPYYFAFFHQNRERHLLEQLTGKSKRTPQNLRVGLFTDTLDEVNGVGRFIRDMGEQAARADRSFTIHTCTKNPRFSFPYRKNFEPTLSMNLPYYPELQLNLPPVLEVLEWADRQQFDVIQVSTPGPMGLMGCLVARMLNIPVLGTYHTDFPAFVQDITGDHRLTSATTGYMRWFYGRMNKVFSRSKDYHQALRKLSVPDEKLLTTLPGINLDKFSPRHRDLDLWKEMGVREQYRLLYCGRISKEKNLPLLVDAFEKLCRTRSDVALIVAGDGPYVKTMKERLEDKPAHFLGYLSDAELGRLYASSDMYLFPSRTDTLGQVVLEAQASGLPVLVSDEGGPKEMMDDGVTGLVLPGTDADRWCNAVNELLNDEARRLRMGRTGTTRMSRFSLERTFEAFWAEHVNVVLPPPPAVSSDERVATPV